MTHSSLKAQLGAVALGLSLALSPLPALAGDNDVSDQDQSSAGAGGTDVAAAAVAQVTQVVTSLGATVSTPAAAQALSRVRAALATNPPGSNEVATAVALAIPELISTDAATTLPAGLTGATAQAAAGLVATMIGALRNAGVDVPPVLGTLSTSLAARI